MRACILIKAQAGKFRSVLGEISKMAGVKTAFPTMGRTDVIAIVDIADLKALSTLALKIGEIDGVAASETLVGLEA